MEPERVLAAALRSAVPKLRLQGRNATKADVLLYEVNGRRVAVKDYTSRPAWIRNTLGRFMVRHEVAAYRAAAGIPGIPTLLGRIGPFAFATAWVDATPLARMTGTELDPRVFDGLDAVLDGLHSRGVALGDLHHRDVLVGDHDEVAVVDFATAWIAPAAAGRWRRAIFRRLADQDRLAAARLRARFTGADEEQALAAAPQEALTRWRRGRRLKRLWDRLRR